MPAETRKRAEDSFVAGRPEDLQAILGTGTSTEDRLPIELLRAYWRPENAREVTQDLARIDLAWERVSDRRLAWLGSGIERRNWSASYPLPARWETDPYPRITALVLDRIRREATGVAGLPDAGPLAAFPDDQVLTWFIENAARPAFHGPQRETWTPEDRADEQRKIEERQGVADRNLVLGVSAVVGLILLGFLLARFSRPR